MLWLNTIVSSTDARVCCKVLCRTTVSKVRQKAEKADKKL